MTVASVGGVFIVLLVGSCVAVISAIVEFVWRAKKIVPEERDPLCVELCRELKVSFIQRTACHGFHSDFPSER